MLRGVFAGPLRRDLGLRLGLGLLDYPFVKNIMNAKPYNKPDHGRRGVQSNKRASEQLDGDVGGDGSRRQTAWRRKPHKQEKRDKRGGSTRYKKKNHLTNSSAQNAIAQAKGDQDAAREMLEEAREAVEKANEDQGKERAEINEGSNLGNLGKLEYDREDSVRRDSLREEALGDSGRHFEVRGGKRSVVYYLLRVIREAITRKHENILRIAPRIMPPGTVCDDASAIKRQTKLKARLHAQLKETYSRAKYEQKSRNARYKRNARGYAMEDDGDAMPQDLSDIGVRREDLPAHLTGSPLITWLPRFKKKFPLPRNQWVREHYKDVFLPDHVFTWNTRDMNTVLNDRWHGFVHHSTGIRVPRWLWNPMFEFIFFFFFLTFSLIEPFFTGSVGRLRVRKYGPQKRFDWIKDWSPLSGNPITSFCWRLLEFMAYGLLLEITWDTWKELTLLNLPFTPFFWLWEVRYVVTFLVVFWLVEMLDDYSWLIEFDDQDGWRLKFLYKSAVKINIMKLSPDEMRKYSHLVECDFRAEVDKKMKDCMFGPGMMKAVRRTWNPKTNSYVRTVSHVSGTMLDKLLSHHTSPPGASVELARERMTYFMSKYYGMNYDEKAWITQFPWASATLETALAVYRSTEQDESVNRQYF